MPAGKVRQELATLALTKLATSDHEAAARLLEGTWSTQLARGAPLGLGVIGKQAAQRLSEDALVYFGKGWPGTPTCPTSTWTEGLRRAARQWQTVRAIDAMTPEARQDSTWVYWKARALLASHPGEGRAPVGAPAAGGHRQPARFL